MVKSRNKFGAKRVVVSGVKCASKFEGKVLAELLKLQSCGLIDEVQPQFKIECLPHKADGTPVNKCKVTHKVDFRIKVGNRFILVEAKGKVTADYRMRAKWLTNWWLPDHPDYSYIVLFEKEMWKGKILSVIENKINCKI